MPQVEVTDTIHYYIHAQKLKYFNINSFYKKIILKKNLISLISLNRLFS